MRNLLVSSLIFALSALSAGCGSDPVVRTVVAVCGDGEMKGDEACDDGNADPSDGCTSVCQLARCGDGVTRTQRALRTSRWSSVMMVTTMTSTHVNRTARRLVVVTPSFGLT